MVYLPQSQAYVCAARAGFDRNLSTVVRLKNGHQIMAKLHVLSVTGSLLSLSQPVDQGSRAKAELVTLQESLWGVAEMSSTSSQQQCCFVAVSQDNHRMLQAAIQSFRRQQLPIKKYGLVRVETRLCTPGYYEVTFSKSLTARFLRTSTIHSLLTEKHTCYIPFQSSLRLEPNRFQLKPRGWQRTKPCLGDPPPCSNSF